MREKTSDINIAQVRDLDRRFTSDTLNWYANMEFCRINLIKRVIYGNWRGASSE